MNFKNDKARTTYNDLDATLRHILEDMDEWADKKVLPFLITRCVDAMIPGVSKTDIHAQRRAADVSVRSWTTDDIDDFVVEFNRKFSEDYGAIGIEDKIKKVVVYHGGTGYHFHIQVGRGTVWKGLEK